MNKTILLITIILSLTTVQTEAQNNPETLKPIVPVSVEVNTQRETKEHSWKIDTRDSETVQKHNSVDLKENLEEMDTDFQRNENRKRRPIARLLFLAAVVVIIVLLV